MRGPALTLLASAGADRPRRHGTGRTEADRHRRVFGLQRRRGAGSVRADRHAGERPAGSDAGRRWDRAWPMPAATCSWACPTAGRTPPPTTHKVDDTVTFIPRFDSIRMVLTPSAAGSALPFELKPELTAPRCSTARRRSPMGPARGWMWDPACRRQTPPASSISPAGPMRSTRRRTACDPGNGRVDAEAHPGVERWQKRLRVRRIRPLPLPVRPRHRRPGEGVRAAGEPVHRQGLAQQEGRDRRQ